MNFNAELIDLFKKTKDIKSDNKAAEALPAMNSGNLSKIRKGAEGRTLNEEQALFIANECNLNPEWVLVQLAESNAKSEEARKTWNNIAKKISKSVLAAILAVTVIFGGFNQKSEPSALST